MKEDFATLELSSNYNNLGPKSINMEAAEWSVTDK